MTTRTIRGTALAASILLLSLGACSPAATEPVKQTAGLSGGGLSSRWSQWFTQAIGIGSGLFQSCAVFNGGRVACWGFALLGDGTSNDSTVPVVSIPSGAKAVSPGGDHSCVLLETGSVLCWGDKTWGALGNGEALDEISLSPVGVIGLTDAVAISAGSGHTCALRSNHTLVCWGEGGYGKLGNGASLNAASPQAVSSLTNVVSVGAGQSHTCAVENLNVYCWGYNYYKQLGNSDSSFVAETPVLVAGISNAASVAVGSNFNCALRTTGDVMCWGTVVDGGLGQVGVLSSSVPITVSGLTDATAVAAGRTHACALRSNHHVVCWGNENSGQLGNINEDRVPSAVPVDVAGLTDAVAVSAGGDVSCALRSNGGVVCWGSDNVDGAPLAIDSPTPLPVAGIGPAQIPVGTNISVTLTDLHPADSVKLTFAEVTAPGAAQLQEVTTPGPGDITIISTKGPIDTWHVDITATFSGESTICFQYPIGITVGGDPQFVALMRYGVDITTLVEPPQYKICGSLGADLGGHCTSVKDCASKHCSDGVCCDADCGNDTNDCQACSAAGICTYADFGASCGPTPQVCEVRGTCPGDGPTCGPSTFELTTKKCATSNDPCYVDSYCSGSATMCPALQAVASYNCDPVSPTDPVVHLNDPDPSDSTSPAGSVTLTFAQLITPGKVGLTETSDSGLSPQPGFQVIGFAGSNHYWLIETDAVYGGPAGQKIHVCVTYDMSWFMSPADESKIRLEHWNGQGVPDPMSEPPNTATKQVCIWVDSLSPFAVVLPSTPEVTVPSDIVSAATRAAGAAVSFSATAHDLQEGALEPTCTPASGSTFPLGTTTVTCTATDSDGHVGTASFHVWVQVQAPTDGTFFLPPINTDGSSIFKLGSTIPVKFKLTGASAAIADLVARLSVVKTANGVTGSDLEASSNGAANDGNLFRYAAGQYIFNLSTKPLSSGTWLLRVDLGDGVTHQINLSLKGGK